MHERVAVKEY